MDNLPKVPPYAKNDEQRQKAFSDTEFNDEAFLDFWPNGIDLSTCTNNQIRIYTNWKRYYYERSTRSSEDLILSFHQDFQGWDEATFARLL